jgi:hypothetical protein
MNQLVMMVEYLSQSIEKNKGGCMIDMSKVRADAFETIAKFPQFEVAISNAYDLMMDEIEAGESEDNEVDHFYSNIIEIIENKIKE